MQACAVHLRDRIDSLCSPFGQPVAVYLRFATVPKARLAEVANLPQPTIQALNRVPFMPGNFARDDGGDVRGVLGCQGHVVLSESR